MENKNNYQLHYDQPTAPSYDGWEKQALPVGNGEMGAKVFGLIGEERIQYNEKTLWSGGPQPDSTDYNGGCLLYTSPSPRDPKTSRMPSSA